MRSLTKTMALAATLLWSAAATAGEPAAVPDTDKADYMMVYASHAEPKPTDPVTLRFSKLTVKKVKFAKPIKDGVEGASAQFEVDLTSLKSNSDKRDQHIKSPDYLDVAKFATLTVDVKNPRHTGDGNYRAPAKVSFRGKSYDWEIFFKVVETLPDGVRIRGEHKLTRKELALGKEAGDSVGQDILVRLQLTLKQPPKKK
jgi:polyisoprenoid-binding protein YceI